MLERAFLHLPFLVGSSADPSWPQLRTGDGFCIAALALSAFAFWALRTLFLYIFAADVPVPLCTACRHCLAAPALPHTAFAVLRFSV